jgi:glycyl-tRNA synthetase
MDHLRWHQHGPDELAHYAKDAYDIEFLFPFGWSELEGVHNRTNFDLSRHGEFSGKPINYMDEETKEYFVPYVIETSAGLTRTVLTVLSDAYEEQNLGKAEDGTEDIRTVMHFHPRLAPVTVGIFPLVKKDGLPEIAREIEETLREDFTTYYDQGGAIGRRYRRQDEIGTPYCITVDYESKENRTVTLRDRDTMEQKRIRIEELRDTLRQSMAEYKRQ